MSNIDLTQLPSLRDTLALTDFRAKKSLGQNFLLDLNVTRKIARFLPEIPKTTIVEIGPGPGGLTRALFAEGATNVVCVDPDERAGAALALLQPTLTNNARLTFLNEDFLKCTLTQISEAPRQVVGNIPYNITSPILIHLLRNIDAIECITLMIQKEVAERLTAVPRTKDYGRLSIITQWCCEAQPLFTLPPSAFVPAPKVHSTVVQLRPRKERAKTTFAALEKLTHALFQQRRKMLRGILKHVTPEQWDACSGEGILPTQRPEELDVKKMCWLANFLAK